MEITKAELRKEFLKRREALGTEFRRRQSPLIHQRIYDLPLWHASSTVLCYVSYGTEVDTHMLIQDALRLKKRVVVPLWRPDGVAEISLLARYEDLTQGGIPRILEPAPHRRQIVDPSEVELALVPGVAFDRRGGRLGLGGGYFDHLVPMMPKAMTIGIAFSAQLSESPLPLGAHDARVRMLATEKEVLVIA